jgi:hypothetical protein
LGQRDLKELPVLLVTREPPETMGHQAHRGSKGLRASLGLRAHRVRRDPSAKLVPLVQMAQREAQASLETMELKDLQGLLAPLAHRVPQGTQAPLGM